MAEFLIFTKNNTHPDPAIETASSYKRGDIISVMEDGHQWGASEGLPTFVVVKIPGVDVIKARKYIDELREDTGILDAQGARVFRLVKKRQFSIDVDNVPSKIKNQLLSTGSVTVTWNQVRNFLYNKVFLTNEGTVDVSRLT